MVLDRELQRKLLLAMGRCYPAPADGRALINEIPGDPSSLPARGQVVAANLAYLCEHGLADANIHISSDGMHRASFSRAKISARGLDFLEDDGGLSAILGVVTVKLHEESLKALLIDRIEQSDENDTIKGELVKQVKALPAEGLKTLATKALEAGLATMPNAVSMIHSWLTQLGAYF